MDGCSDGQTQGDSANCLGRIVGVKLTDRHRLENMREKYGTSSRELMVRRKALQWMGHVLRKDAAKGQLQEIASGRTEAKTGSQGQERFSGMYSSAIRGCHEKGYGCGTISWDFPQLTRHGFEQRQRHVPWAGRPGGMLFITLLNWKLGSPKGWTSNTLFLVRPVAGECCWSRSRPSRTPTHSRTHTHACTHACAHALSRQLLFCILCTCRPDLQHVVTRGGGRAHGTAEPACMRLQRASPACAIPMPWRLGAVSMAFSANARRADPLGSITRMHSKQAKPSGSCTGMRSRQAKPSDICTGTHSKQAKPSGSCTGMSSKQAKPSGSCTGMRSKQAKPPGIDACKPEQRLHTQPTCEFVSEAGRAPKTLEQYLATRGRGRVERQAASAAGCATLGHPVQPRRKVGLGSLGKTDLQCAAGGGVQGKAGAPSAPPPHRLRGNERSHLPCCDPNPTLPLPVLTTQACTKPTLTAVVSLSHPSLTLPLPPPLSWHRPARRPMRQTRATQAFPTPVHLAYHSRARWGPASRAMSASRWSASARRGPMPRTPLTCCARYGAGVAADAGRRARRSEVRCGTVRAWSRTRGGGHGIARYDVVRCGAVPGSAWHGAVRCGAVLTSARRGVVRCGTVLCFAVAGSV
eukprot:350318-Chlamydomonas_euryale.AAC.4